MRAHLLNLFCSLVEDSITHKTSVWRERQTGRSLFKKCGDKNSAGQDEMLHGAS